MSKVIGSSKIEETSVDSFELVNYRGADNTFTKPSSLKSLVFVSLSDCTVNINGGGDILVRKDEIIEFDKEIKIDSFVINEKGTKYRYMAII